MIKVWTAEMSLILLPSKGGWTRMYELEAALCWYSKRYNKSITVPAGFRWDGATKAIDFLSISHMVHDYVVGTDDHPGTWVWDDGTEITILQSSQILHDILDTEDRKHVANRWYRATLLWQTIKRIFKGRKGTNNG